MPSTLDSVMRIAARTSGVKLAKLSSTSAVDQDMRMAGDDVVDFAEALVKEFGDQVWSWPWYRFAQLDEGLSPLFPFLMIWQLISWPFRGSFEYPSPFERIELGHIAAVVVRGGWFEP